MLGIQDFLKLHDTCHVVSYIYVTKVSVLLNYLVDIKCSDLEIIKLPKDIITVSGEHTQLNCLFQGSLHTPGLSLTN